MTFLSTKKKNHFKDVPLVMEQENENAAEPPKQVLRPGRDTVSSSLEGFAQGITFQTPIEIMLLE